MTQWAALTHSHVLFRRTVLTDSTRPCERHVHQRASGGNADWESVATTRAHSTPEAKTGHFLHISILSNPTNTTTSSIHIPSKTETQNNLNRRYGKGKLKPVPLQA